MGGLAATGRNAISCAAPSRQASPALHKCDGERDKLSLRVHDSWSISQIGSQCNLGYAIWSTQRWCMPIRETVDGPTFIASRHKLACSNACFYLYALMPTCNWPLTASSHISQEWSCRLHGHLHVFSVGRASRTTANIPGLTRRTCVSDTSRDERHHRSRYQCLHDEVHGLHC